MTNLDHALAYAARGWPVFPTRITKAPYTQHGLKDATTNAEQIREWWAQWPNAGIGIATGSIDPEGKLERSGFFALDRDDDKGGKISLESLEFEHGLLSETLISRTGGGGRHYLYRMPAGREVRNKQAEASGLPAGIDTRGTGGYIIAPPSMHESGNTYEWEIGPDDEVEIADAPAWLLDLVCKPREAAVRSVDYSHVKNPRAYGRRALESACEDVRNAVPAAKNTLLNVRAFAMRDLIERGYITRSEAESALQLAAEERDGRSAHPDGTTALQATIKSGLGDVQGPIEPGPSAVTTSGFVASPVVLPSGEPMTVAEHVLRTLHHDQRGRLLLRRWREQWWRYDDGVYRAVAAEEFTGQLWSALRDQYVRGVEAPKRYAPNTSKIANVASAMLGLGTQIESDAEPPLWIADRHRAAASDTISVENGLLNLSTGTLSEPTPELFSTTRIATRWNSQVLRPKAWLMFLDSIFGEDGEAIALLQEWFGYVLTSDMSQQKILFVVGPRRGGKGTIARVLTAMLGKQNVAGPTLGSFGERFGLATMLGKPLAIVADARLSGKADQAPIVERLLSISGEDSIDVDRKHRSTITVRLPTRLMILSNELPMLRDASAALASRMMLLQLHKSFLGSEDTALESKLLGELEGILFWAVEGWKRLRVRGRFVAPRSSRAAGDDLERLASPVRAFAEDEAVFGAAEWVTKTFAFERWKAWCSENGHQPGSAEMFGRSLRAAFPELRNDQREPGGERRKLYTGMTLEGARERGCGTEQSLHVN
jgi:putative DNA primase/helicase